MKKLIVLILALVCMIGLVGCRENDTYKIGITVPAGSTEAFVYSDEEILTTGNKITIWSGDGLDDTEVILQPVNEMIETGYVATYLTHGMPVEFDAVKDEWFKIGVSMQNDTDADKIVYVEVESVEVRIAEKTEETFQATILEIKDTYYIVEPVEGSQELKSADQITVSMKNLDPSLEPEVGDIIEVTYNGEIAESYPAQITEVYSIKVVKEINKEAEETITYNGKEYKKSELCNATLHWLELSEQERIASSYMPPEFMELTENWGISLTAENITPTGVTIVCTQFGGEPTGELQTGSWYIVENWTQENGWKEMPCLAEVCWTEEAWLIMKDEVVGWDVDWEWLYGTLPAGRYRIGKEIMDFRATSDYDTAIYFAEFKIGAVEENTELMEVMDEM